MWDERPSLERSSHPVRRDPRIKPGDAQSPDMAVHQVTADPDTTTPDALAALRDAGVCYDPDRFTCNAYLITGERTVLVDVGTLPGIVDAVRDRAGTVDAVVLTHQHGDHVARLDAVLDAFDPDCYAFAGHARRTHELADGDTVLLGDDEFAVAHTPGHADDHVALLGETTVFSGDVLVPNDEAFDDGSFGSTGGPGPARERLIESLRRLRDRLPATVEHLYAGHGDAFHGDVHGLAATALERAEQREPKYE